MDLAIELAKGTLQYAPSYIATLVQFLTGPVKFLLEVLRSPEKGEELKKAFSFAFLTIVLVGFLFALGPGPAKYAIFVIINVVIKMLQVALMVASIHLALRIVAVRTDHVALTPVALYFISISYLGLAIIILAIRGYDPEASFTVFVTLFVIFILPVFIMFWTVLYRGLHLAPWKALASFLLFVTMFLVYGNILNLVIQELDRQLS